MSAGTILVIDDNPDNLKLVLHFLRAKGYGVEGAASTAEADRAIALRCPQLVLVDVALPQEDGLTWVQRVKGQPGAPAHYVAITAHADPQVGARARQAGCEELLTKPVPLKELLRLAQTYVDGAPAAH